MTQRSKSELDDLFANNNTRQISPADLRDLVDSCKPSYGAMHFADPGSSTTIVTPGTHVKAANVSTLLQGNRFTMSANNRLLYGGVVAAPCNILAAISFNCAANNQVLCFAFAINGVLFVPSKVRTKISTGTDIQAAAVVAQTILQPNDYVELWLTNETSTGAVTVDHGIVQAIGFLS